MLEINGTAAAQSSPVKSATRTLDIIE